AAPAVDAMVSGGTLTLYDVPVRLGGRFVRPGAYVGGGLGLYGGVPGLSASGASAGGGPGRPPAAAGGLAGGGPGPQCPAGPVLARASALGGDRPAPHAGRCPDDAGRPAECGPGRHRAGGGGFDALTPSDDRQMFSTAGPGPGTIGYVKELRTTFPEL